MRTHVRRAMQPLISKKVNRPLLRSTQPKTSTGVLRTRREAVGSSTLSVYRKGQQLLQRRKLLTSLMFPRAFAGQYYSMRRRLLTAAKLNARVVRRPAATRLAPATSTTKITNTLRLEHREAASRRLSGL
jgi:hypothetical protein